MFTLRHCEEGCWSSGLSARLACIETKLDEAISRKLQIVSPWRHATLRSTPSSSGFALRSGRDAPHNDEKV